jgi:ABC-type glycerol-3-phosphate transport system substrate-binding protein
MMIWYTDLVRLYEVQSPKTGDTPTDIALTNALIREGRVAMWPFSLSEFITQRDGTSLDFDIGVAPEPMGLTGARGDLATYSQGFYIMADSPHREACWQWITFLMRHPEAGWLGHSVPAHIETAESPAYISTVGEEVAAASQAFMSFGRPSPHVEEPDWFFPGHIWLEVAYLDVISEQKDVATALAEADTQFTQYRQCLINENGFNHLDTQISCALAADPSLSNRSDFPQN